MTDTLNWSTLWLNYLKVMKAKTFYFEPSLNTIRAYILLKHLEGRPVSLDRILFGKRSLSKEDFEKNKAIALSRLLEAESLEDIFVRVSTIFYKLSCLVKNGQQDVSSLQEVFFTEKHLCKVK